MIFDSTMTRALTLRNDMAISDAMLTLARVTNACSHRLKYFTKTMKKIRINSAANRTPPATRIDCRGPMAGYTSNEVRQETSDTDVHESPLLYGCAWGNANWPARR